MNQFIKSNKPWLSLLALAVIIVVLAFILRPKTIDFSTNAEQSIQLINDPENKLEFSQMTGLQLIDLRSQDLFLQGHAPNAINIPLRNLLDDESLELFDQLKQSNQVAVLYANDELEATAPSLLLQQLGYSNLKIYKGGYAANNRFMETNLQLTEAMLLDTLAMRAKPEIKAPEAVKKKPQAVVPIRQEVSAGGGC